MMSKFVNSDPSNKPHIFRIAGEWVLLRSRGSVRLDWAAMRWTHARNSAQGVVP